MSDTSFGKILEIDEKTITAIDGVAGKIDAIAGASQRAADSFVSHFGRMGDSAQQLSDKLTTIKGLLDGMGVDLTKPIAENLSSASTAANTAAASITRAATAMSEFGVASTTVANGKNPFANLRYAELTTQLEQAKAKLPEYQAQLDKVNERINLMNTAMSRGRTDVSMYAEAMNKAKAEAASISAAMTKTTESIALMNQEVERRKTLNKKSNDATKDSIALYQMESREIEKLYTKLFDLAGAREKAAQKKKEKADNAAVKEEQRIYSQLEQQLIKVQALKRKSISDDGAIKDIDNYNKVLDLEKRITKQMEDMRRKNANLKTNDVAQVTAKQREIEATERLTKAQDKLNKKREEEYRKTPNGALSFAQNEVRTYNDRVRAIKYLEAAMKDLDISGNRNSKTFRDLAAAHDRLTREQAKVRSAMFNIKDSMASVQASASKLTTSLTAVFSVRAITGYTKKLIEVRGEFELQNVALRAILQNKDEADKLFAQVTQLAVKSPYSIRQLTSYTKQLAAYRVESSKLYDTTKRLADVSSGLGVDMQRIILAYGQVKAANYLRATEVRQFTEAGINVLGELSKYYSELEQRMVSVGDVQERITKRMVEFGDVEEIFRRMTDAGGLFYDMQAKQAQTLQGMMANLKDSLDIMLNEIGKATEPALKGAISTLTKFLKSWRDIVAGVGTAAAIFVSMRSIIALYTMGMKNAGDTVLWHTSALKKHNIELLLNGKNWSAARLKMMGFTASQIRSIQVMKLFQAAARGVGMAMKTMLPIAVIAGVSYMIAALTKANRDAKVLRKELNKMIAEDAAEYEKSVRQYENLVNRLKDINTGSEEHSRIIDQLNSQYGDYIGFLVTEKTTYEQMRGTIAGVNQQLREKAALATADKALSKVYEKTADNIADAQEALKNMSVQVPGVGTIIPTEQELKLFFNNYDKKVRELGRKLTDNEVQESLAESLGKSEVLLQGNVFQWRNIRYFADATLERVKAEQNVESMINQGYDARLTSVEQVNALKELERQRDAKFTALSQRSDTTDFERKKERQKIELEYQEARIRKMAEFGIMTQEAADTQIAALTKQAPLMESINTKFSTLAKNAGYTEEQYDKFVLTNTKWEKGLSNIEKEVTNGWQQQKEIVEAQERYKKQGLSYNEKELKTAQEQKKLYEIMAGVLGLSLVKEKQVNKANQERISLLKKIRQEYEENRKVMGKQEASDFTKSQYKDNAVYKQLESMGVIDASLDVDASGLITALKKLADKTTGAARKEIEEMIASLQNENVIIQIKANLDAVKTEIEGLFDRVELTKELRSLGLGDELASELFNFDTLDLDGLEAALNEKKAEYAAANHQIGTDEAKYFAEVEKRITDQRTKELKERLKEYSKYLKSEYSAAVNARLEEVKKLADIDSLRISDEQKKVMKEGVQRETAKKIDDAKWKEFQESEMYIKLFDDLEYVSQKTLESMKEKLIDLKSSLKNLSPESLKHIMTQLNKIDEQLIKMHPYDTLKQLREQTLELAAAGKSESSLGEELQLRQDELDAMIKERDVVDEIKGIWEMRGKEEATIRAQQLGRLDLMGQEFDVLEQTSSEYNEQIDAQRELIAIILNLLGLYDQQRQAVVETKQAWDSIKAAIEKARASINEILSAFDIDEDDLPFSNMALDLIEMTGDAFMFQMQLEACTTSAEILGVSIKTAMGWMGWILLGVEAIAKVVTAIVTTDRRRFEKQIEEHQEQVDRLQKAYEQLENAIDDCYDIDNLRRFNKEAQKTLEETIAEEKAMIAMYKARKNGSQKYKDEIRELEDSISDAEESLQELAENLIESLGGFGSQSNLKSAAESFVDAWKTAFDETGAGLSGLQDKMDEFVNNAVQKQLLLRLSDRYIRPILEEFDKMFEEASPGGELMTKEELAAWKKLYEQYAEAFDDKAKAYLDALGITSEAETGGLSGLTQEIGQMTEATANALAAIVESIRYFVADTNTTLHNIELIFTMPGENPFYLLMQQQAQYTKDIRDMIQRTFTTIGTNSALKVQIV